MWLDNGTIHGRLQEFFKLRTNILGVVKFETHGTGSNESAESQWRTAKSVNILICFKFSKLMWIVSLPYIVKN